MLLHAQPLWLPTLVVSVCCAAEMGGLVHLSLAELLPQDPAGSRTTSTILAAMQSRGGNTTAFIYPVRVPLYCVYWTGVLQATLATWRTPWTTWPGRAGWTG